VAFSVGWIGGMVLFCCVKVREELLVRSWVIEGEDSCLRRTHDTSGGQRKDRGCDRMSLLANLAGLFSPTMTQLVRPLSPHAPPLSLSLKNY